MSEILSAEVVAAIAGRHKASSVGQRVLRGRRLFVLPFRTGSAQREIAQITFDAGAGAAQVNADAQSLAAAYDDVGALLEERDILLKRIEALEAKSKPVPVVPEEHKDRKRETIGAK